MRRLFTLSLSAAGCFVLIGAIVIIWIFNSSSSFLNREAVPDSLHAQEDGLSMTAKLSDIKLEPGDEMEVAVSVKNVAGRTLHYYRCGGVPIGVVGYAPDDSMSLKGDYGQVCGEESYSPDNVQAFEAGEEVKKQITIYPEIRMSHRAIDAPAGEYRVHVSFRTEEGNKVTVEKIINVHNTNTPIITKEKAVQAAGDHPDVQTWMKEQKEEGVAVEAEEHFLSDLKWIVMYHTDKYSPEADEVDGKRIVIHVNAKSGEVADIHQEDYSSKSGE